MDPKEYRKRVQYQLIGTAAIAAAGNAAVLANAAQTDEEYDYVTGVVCSIKGDESGIQNSVFNTFRINENTVFSKDAFEAKLIGTTRNTDVKPNDKFYAFEDGDGNRILYPAKNSKVDITYTDGSFAGVVYPYTINVWLRLENVDEDQLKEENRLIKALQKLLKDHKE